AMQQGKQPFWAGLQLLARLTLNAGKHAGNQPTRLAHLDDGNDRAILVQGDEGPAQSLPRRRPGSFGWGIRALHQLAIATMVPFPRRLPHTISLLEEAGFEPPVPPGKSVAFSRRREGRKPTGWSRKLVSPLEGDQQF